MAPREIRLDLFGSVVSVRRELVDELRAEAAAQAGVSSQHRDLSLVLDRALETGGAVLGRSDVRALVAVLELRAPDADEEVADLVRAATRER
jgi:hypothetical protein